MPEKWTGVLIGKMHNERVSCQELATELGIARPYLSMILNGSRKPQDAKERLNTAFNAIVERRKESK